jgi:hypothetical protein
LKNPLCDGVYYSLHQWRAAIGPAPTEISNYQGSTPWPFIHYPHSCIPRSAPIAQNLDTSTGDSFSDSATTDPSTELEATDEKVPEKKTSFWKKYKLPLVGAGVIGAGAVVWFAGGHKLF